MAPKSRNRSARRFPHARQKAEQSADRRSVATSIKVLSIFGTRPEAIKLFPLLHALEADARFSSRSCVTGQHAGMLTQVLDLAQIKPDHAFELLASGQSLDDLTARALTMIGPVIEEETPDWVVVQGDTTSAMAGALAAHYRRVPICHVEAGLRSGNMQHPWPEEANRKIIGALASLHCAPTQTAADALLREGVNPDAIHVTGNTVIDALYWMRDRLAEKPELALTMLKLERRFTGKKIIGVTAHRRENIGRPMEEIAKALAELADRDDVAIVFPLHPNPQIRNIMKEHLSGRENIALTEPFDYPNFVRLMDSATLMLTDSGGVQEEATTLGTPVLVMREATERPEGVKMGASRLAGMSADDLEQAASDLIRTDEQRERPFVRCPLYGSGKSSQKIVDLLMRLAPD